MALIDVRGPTVQHENFRVYPNDIATWEELDTVSWDNWNSWFLNANPNLDITMPEHFDLGQVETFNIITNVQARGQVSYKVIYSNEYPMLDSLNNYQELVIPAGSTEIPSITARYFWIQIQLTRDPGEAVQYFDGMSVSVSTQERALSYSNVNSALLSGTKNNRLFAIPESVGGIRSVQISSQGSDSYDVDLYVSNIATSTKTYPRIINKSNSGVNLTFVGIDGQSYDSVFDIQLTVTPEWYIDSQGNLQER